MDAAAPLSERIMQAFQFYVPGVGYYSTTHGDRDYVIKWDAKPVATHGPAEGFASLTDAKDAALALSADGSRDPFGGRASVVLQADERYVPVEVRTNFARMNRDTGEIIPDDGFDPANLTKSPIAREGGWQVAAAITALGTELPIGPAPRTG